MRSRRCCMLPDLVRTASLGDGELAARDESIVADDAVVCRRLNTVDCHALWVPPTLRLVADHRCPATLSLIWNADKDAMIALDDVIRLKRQLQGRCCLRGFCKEDYARGLTVQTMNGIQITGW